MLVKHHHAADEDVREDDDDDDDVEEDENENDDDEIWMDEIFNTRKYWRRRVSLLICCAFVAMTASSSSSSESSSSLGVSKFSENNKGGLLNVYGSKEAGASTASRAKFSATTTNKEEESMTQLAQLGYADVDLDTAALLGAKERNMIQASLAIEDVQRKIKRLEKAKRQRALNVQDEDEYLEDEVTADVNVGEGEEEAVATATTGGRRRRRRSERSERRRRRKKKSEKRRTNENAAVRMLTGEDPVVEENEEKEGDESNNDEAEKALPQASSTIVNQKLEEELKEEEKNNASAESEESVEEKKSSLEEMALAFEKEMERAALEDEFTATPEEKVKEGEQEPEATATAEVDPSETANEKTPEEGEEEEEEEQQGEQGEIITPLESLTTTTTTITPRQSSLLRGSTKRDLSDTEFSKLQKLLEYNAKKRGVDLKSSSSADTTPEQPPKAELCPSSAIYAGKCECSSSRVGFTDARYGWNIAFGKEIDSHECVARMNAQYIEVQNPSDSNKLANPRDYGSKTDFVFSNVVDHTLKDLRKNLNTTEGKKLNQKVKHKFLHVPFWRPASEVFDFLEAHNDWKTIPHAVTKETTDLFSQMKGAEGKQWSSGFLAYVMLSRHYCAKTAVYSYWRAEEDPASQVYVTNSKGGARKMWSGHSFGGEHEFIKNAAESHDFGTRVRYLDALKKAQIKVKSRGYHALISTLSIITSCCINKLLLLPQQQQHHHIIIIINASASGPLFFSLSRLLLLESFSAFLLLSYLCVGVSSSVQTRRRPRLTAWQPILPRPRLPFRPR